MPDREEAGFELALKGDKTSTYEIGAENIKKLCENPENAEELVLNKDEAFVCEIFVFIENPSKERISYSLTLWKAGYPIDLHEGHALTFNLESIEKGQHMQFFY
jgi:hypothetical protein